MPEVRPNATAHRSGAAHRPASGFELRLDRGGAHVHLAPSPPGSGLAVEALDLEIPDVRQPIDLGAGPSQFQNRLCDLCKLAVRLEPGFLAAAAARVDRAALGLDALEVALQDGFVEVGGTLRGGPAFALRIALVQGVERGVQAVPYAARVFGPSAVPAAGLAAQAARALRELGVPDEPLPALLRKLLVSRGWKAPRDQAVRLSALSVTPVGIKLAWDRLPAGPVSPPIDPDLLAALEGARAFAGVEQLLADGDWDGARDALLSDPAAPSHPFAAERLLSLLCLEERFHDEALDLAADWLARRPGFAPALAAEAWIRLVRGEQERAASALVGLAEEAVARNERVAAAAAAEAALALTAASRATRQRAVDAALAVKRDHLPAIRALRTLAKEIGDKGGQLRAVRRLLAYAPGDAEKARAHAELGELLLDKDPPAARLHLDRALRLDPGDPESVATLARACLAAGEHLRAVRALDRLRELKLKAGDTAEAARLALQTGALWESPLGHLENAWLRYREAAELGPGAAEAHRLAASCAARLGRWADAADHHAAALALLDAGTPAGAAAAAAHHLALAEVAELHLDDPAGAAGHLEAASALAPPDPARLARLASLYRRLDRPAELAAALERLAPLGADPVERAALLAEAGDLLRQRLGRDEAAQARYAAALGHEPACRRALSGMAAVASARGDAAAERDALQRLLAISGDKGEQAVMLDRLASACERSGDLPAAARALASARRLAPTRARLAAAVALARTAGDRASLGGLLDELARAASADGDPAGAAAAFRERSDLLEPDDLPLAMASLAEARRLLPGDTALLRREAALAARSGDHQLALGALKALLEGEPVDAPALELTAARTALAAGQLTEACAHAQRAFVAGATGAVEVLDEALERSGDESGRAGLLSRLGRHLEAAALHEQRGDTSAAAGALEAAAAVPATAVEALRHLIRLRAQRGDAPGTAAALVAAARLAGGREGAELALRAFHLAPSDEALDVASAADPAFAPARAERARRRAGHDPDGALSDAEAALAGEALDPVRRPELLRLSSRLALSAGDAELGRRRLAAFCQVGVPDDDDLARLADLQRMAGDREGLVAALERRLPLAPPELALPLRLELADLLAGLGHDQEAVARWRQALSLDRKALPALRALLDPARGGVLVDGERPALLTLLARHPEADAAARAAAWDELATLRETARDLRGAMDAIGEAARLRGQEDEALELQAALATRLGDQAAAAKALLARARRGLERAEAGAPARLVEAGLAALGAGLESDGVAALEQAIGLAPGAEALRSARTALLERAGRMGDLAGEAGQLALLLPLLPTGERPSQLLRLSDLRAALHDRAGALVAAEEARQLAPRDLQTVHRTRLAAEAADRPERVAALLAEEAELDEALAGPLLLDRARRLAALGQHEAADDAFGEAQRRLDADLAVATEQSRLRRAFPMGRSPAEPLERCARRLAEPGAAARAFLAAGALALQEDDRATALRCARRAYSRRRDAPAEAGPLLARLLYERGAFAEALVLHRTLLESGFAGLEDADVVALCRQLAELATEAGERALALQALDRLLSLRPQEAEAARLRFALDPDRARAVSALAEVAGRHGSEATRAALLGLAAEGALAELRDRSLGERLFREARGHGARVAGAVLELARRRVEVTRGADLGPEALLSALQEAAETAGDAGLTGEARRHLEEAVREERSRGMRTAAARDLAQLEALHAVEGDFKAAAARARQAGELLAEAGDLPAALEAMERAAEGEPAHRPTLERIAELARSRGADGARSLCGALGRLAELSRGGPARAEALLRLAEAEETALGDAGRAEASLQAALAEAPGHAGAEAALQALLARTGRTGDLARRLLEQARRQEAVSERTSLRRRAAELLGRSGEKAELDLAAEAAVAIALDWPGDVDAARAAAAALQAAGRRDEAVPHLALVARAEPDDEQATAALLEAYASRPGERAELHLARAAAAQGATRAARLREASQAFTEAGQAMRAEQAMDQAFQAWPADEAAFAGAVAAAGEDMDRLDAVLMSRAVAVPAEAAGCHRARADMLFTMGRLERAAEAFEAALAADPEDAAGLATLGACLVSLHGPEAARYTDRRLAALAELRPGRVPASQEAEARYRLGLHADPAAPAVSIRTDLERALWLAPDDQRSDQAFATLAEAHLRLDDPLGALSALRARADRAAARGDEAAELAALERGAAVAAELPEPGPDGAAIMDGLLVRRAAHGAPSTELEPLARRVAETWRALDQEPRARLALARAGLPPVEPPAHLVSIPAEPAEAELEILEPAAVEPVVAEPVVVEPVAAEPVVAEPVVVEPVVAEPVAAEPVVAEPVAAEPVVAEPVVAEPVAAEPVVAEPVAVEPVAELIVETPEALEPQADLSAPTEAEAVEPAFALEPSPPDAEPVAEAESWDGLYGGFGPAPHELFASPEDAEDLLPQLPFQGLAPSNAAAEEASELAAALGQDDGQLALDLPEETVQPELQPVTASGEPTPSERPAPEPAFAAGLLEPVAATEPAVEAAPEQTAIAEPPQEEPALAEVVETTPEVAAETVAEPAFPVAPVEPVAAEPTVEVAPDQTALVEPSPVEPAFDEAPEAIAAAAEVPAEVVAATGAEPAMAAAPIEPIAAEPAVETTPEESAFVEPSLEEPTFDEAPQVFEAAAEPPAELPAEPAIAVALLEQVAAVEPAVAQAVEAAPEEIAFVEPSPKEPALDEAPGIVEGAVEPPAELHAEPALEVPAEALAEPVVQAAPEEAAFLEPSEVVAAVEAPAEPLAEPALEAAPEVPAFAEPQRPATLLPDVIHLDAGPSHAAPPAAAEVEASVFGAAPIEPTVETVPEPSEVPAPPAGAPSFEEQLPFEPALAVEPAPEPIAVEPAPAAFYEAPPLLAEPASLEPEPAEPIAAALPDAFEPAVEEPLEVSGDELQFSLEEHPAAAEVAAPPEAVELVEEEDDDARREAEGHARVAEATLDPRDRALAWLASAEALARARAAPDEVRQSIDRACEADADALEPWTALAAHLDEYGRPLEAARAHLAVSIRSEGSRAATASLTAARLFHLASRHEDAARAFRVANAAQAHCVPPALILAEQALARGDLDSASENLVLIDEQALPEAIRSTFRHALAQASGTAHSEPSPAEPVTAPPPEPIPTSEELAAATAPSWPIETAPQPASAPQAAVADPVAAILREQADLADGPDRATLLERLAGHFQRSGRAGEAADALMEALLTDPARAEGWQRLNELVELAPDRAPRAAVLRSRLLPSGGLVPLPSPGAEAAASSPDAGTDEPWATTLSDASEPLDLGLASAEDLARQLKQTTDDFVLEPTPPPLALPPVDRATQIFTLVREHAAAGNRRALASISDEAESLLGIAVLRPFATSLGRAALDTGRAEVAYRWLMLAREDDPEELTISRDLSRAAERTGRHAEEVAFGEPCADAIAPHDPLAASARYHHLAHVLADKVGDLAGAAAIVEKALALVPDDRGGRRQLWSLWGRLEESRPRALDAWLEAARRDPSDVEALGQAADLAALLATRAAPEQAARYDERARLTTSLAAFVSHGRSAPATRLASTLPQEARDAVAAPGAGGPLGLLLGMLAPYLEPLFPADLARRGATAADRLSAPRAPVVRQALERAAALLDARAHVPFLVDRPGVDLALENTRPPALVVPAGVEALPEPVVLFLAVRALDLLGRGWALAGKFAPRDVAILLELACRFAGASTPSMGLPPERAAAFLGALTRSVPPSLGERVRPLGAAAADELSRVDVRLLTAAIRSTGARVALLATGDPNAALTALQLIDRQRVERPGAAGPFQAPEQHELAELALSDPFLLLRSSVIA